MFEIAKPFLLSLALGLMVGIERERAFTGEHRQIPFGARTYTISPTGGQGQWTGTATLDGESYANPTGTLWITRFDATGVVGKFRVEFRQIGGDKRLALEGGMDFRCPREFSKCAP